MGERRWNVSHKYSAQKEVKQTLSELFSPSPITQNIQEDYVYDHVKNDQKHCPVFNDSTFGQ